MVDNRVNADTIFAQNDSGTPHVHTQQNTNPPQQEMLLCWHISVQVGICW